MNAPLTTDEWAAAFRLREALRQHPSHSFRTAELALIQACGSEDRADYCLDHIERWSAGEDFPPSHQRKYAASGPATALRPAPTLPAPPTRGGRRSVVNYLCSFSAWALVFAWPAVGIVRWLA